MSINILLDYRTQKIQMSQVKLM